LPLKTYFEHRIALGLPSVAAYGFTRNPHVGDYKGRTGMSPPAVYTSTVGNEANEGSLYPRHHVYAIDYYSRAV
jgi:hypothetical protein